MQITAPIILFISISYVLVQSIFSLGKENITIITGIVGALTNVAINFMLIPHWAQDGAAIGTLLAEFSVMIAYLFIIRRFSIISIFTRHTALCLFAVAIMGTCLWGSVFVEVFSYLKSVCNAIGGRCGLCHSFEALLKSLYFWMYAVWSNKE